MVIEKQSDVIDAPSPKDYKIVTRADEIVGGYQRLDFYFSHLAYEFMTPEFFPELPPDHVAEVRFIATTNATQQLFNIRQATNDPEIRNKLDIKITNLVTERDATYLESLSGVEGTADPDVIVFHEKRRRDIEGMRLLFQLVDRGLVDMINIDFLPELSIFSDEMLQFSRYKAAENYLEELIKILNGAGGDFAFDNGQQARSGSDDSAQGLKDKVHRAVEKKQEQLRAYLDQKPPPANS